MSLRASGATDRGAERARPIGDVHDLAVRRDVHEIAEGPRAERFAAAECAAAESAVADCGEARQHAERGADRRSVMPGRRRVVGNRPSVEQVPGARPIVPAAAAECAAAECGVLAESAPQSGVMEGGAEGDKGRASGRRLGADATPHSSAQQTRSAVRPPSPAAAECAAATCVVAEGGAPRPEAAGRGTEGRAGRADERRGDVDVSARPCVVQSPGAEHAASATAIACAAAERVEEHAGGASSCSETLERVAGHQPVVLPGRAGERCPDAVATDPPCAAQSSGAGRIAPAVAAERADGALASGLVAEGHGPLDTADMPTFFALTARRARLWMEGHAPAAPDPSLPVADDHPDADIPEPQGRHPTRHMARVRDVGTGGNPASHHIGRMHRQLAICGTPECVALVEVASIRRIARKRAGASAVVHASDACTLCVRGTRAGASRLALTQMRHVQELLRRFVTLHARPTVASDALSPPLADEAVGRAALAALRLAAQLLCRVRALEKSEVDAVHSALAIDGAGVPPLVPPPSSQPPSPPDDVGMMRCDEFDEHNEHGADEACYSLDHHAGARAVELAAGVERMRA